MTRPTDLNLLAKVRREAAAWNVRRPKPGPGQSIRQAQYDMWKAGIEFKHSASPGPLAIGLEPGDQRFRWPKGDEA